MALNDRLFGAVKPSQSPLRAIHPHNLLCKSPIPEQDCGVAAAVTMPRITRTLINRPDTAITCVSPCFLAILTMPEFDDAGISGTRACCRDHPALRDNCRPHRYYLYEFFTDRKHLLRVNRRGRPSSRKRARVGQRYSVALAVLAWRDRYSGLQRFGCEVAQPEAEVDRSR
jgi:hypothetical protein